MLKKAIIALVTIATLGVATLTPANAIGLGSAGRGITKNLKFSRGGSAVPLPYLIFCLKNSAECKAGTTTSISYTAKVRSTLASVNRSVNRSIRPLNERRDVWSLNPAYGDCDDYVMTKRSKLIRAGIPSGALRVAVVRTRQGVGHAVLIVKTSSGEYILDNLRQTVVQRYQSGYRYLKVSGANPLHWASY